MKELFNSFFFSYMYIPYIIVKIMDKRILFDYIFVTLRMIKKENFSYAVCIHLYLVLCTSISYLFGLGGHSDVSSLMQCFYSQTVNFYLFKIFKL